MDELDKTIPPQERKDMAVDLTIPGKRDRKPDGRFEVGDLILNRYKVLAELGQGGMGVVYKCLDEVAGVEIALKALPPELSHNSLEMEDVKDNFQLVHNLHHPNIASSNTLEKDNSNGNYYLIMECVEGDNLRHWIRRKRKERQLTVETILPIIRQVAAALDYAHEERIIHRDIKPGNIMIDAAGHVKVLDFGLAAQIHTSMTRVSMAYHGTSGTAPYMAPEQWRGRAQGAAADQYALAVMTYEMLSGHLPFESTDAAVLQQAVLTQEPEEIEGISDSAKKALARGMSKKAEDRFPSCMEFASSLAGTPPPVEKLHFDSTQKSRSFMSNVVTSGNATTIMRRIPILIEQMEWDKAREYCEKLLDSEPENPELYFMLCLIEHKAQNETMLIKVGNEKLNEDKNFSIAVKFASPERKKQLLFIQNESLISFHLGKCMSERGVSSISELAHSNKSLIDDINFQTAIKNASAELQQELLCIQKEQSEFFLTECMKTYGVSQEEELSHCTTPLREDKNYLIALQCSSADRQQDLLSLSANQSNYFLKICLDTNQLSNEKDLSRSNVTLTSDTNFQIALRCASPDRQKELLSIQCEQAEFFLKECLRIHGKSKESELSHLTQPLANDTYFQKAILCASPEQKTEWLKIQNKQEMRIFFTKKIAKICAFFLFVIILFFVSYYLGSYFWGNQTTIPFFESKFGQTNNKRTPLVPFRTQSPTSASQEKLPPKDNKPRFSEDGNTLLNVPNDITAFRIPDNVTIIGDSAFISCSSLRSVTIPNSVRSIGKYAFSGCKSLTSVTIPVGVTYVGDFAFQGCTALSSVTIPIGLKRIETGTFSGCSSLISVTIPSSVTSIDEFAFYNAGCEEQVKRDYSYAFKNNSSAPTSSDTPKINDNKKNRSTISPLITPVNSKAPFERRQPTQEKL